MSSSSSLSGARRRRAGGGSGPTSTSSSQQGPPPQQRIPAGMKGPPPQRIPAGMKGPPPQIIPAGMKGPPPPVNTPPQGIPQGMNDPSPNNLPINPIQILQQHELKISSMENVLHEIMSNKNKEDVPDINKISENILGNLEEKLDLKSFYENDEKLFNELEVLKNTVQSQQMVINGLNSTLYNIISQLKLSSPSDNVNEIIEDMSQDVSDDINDNKSVFINEENNMTLEIENREDNLENKLDNPSLD